MARGREAYVRFLRQQAQRCYCAAARIEDQEFAAELMKIGHELAAKADILERGASNSNGGHA
jgi:hypothetical protein